MALLVTVASVEEKDAPIQLQAIGTAEAYSSVAIKTQINGEIFRAHFQEGQFVKKNDLLFTIDPRPFEAALKQAEANLAKDMAQVEQAEANLARDMAQVKQAEANLARDMTQEEYAAEEARRYELLVGKGYVAREQADQFRTQAEALKATVSASRAALDNANAAVRASRAAVENARAEVQASAAAVENAKLQLAYCFIHSPIDGRTGSILVQQGNIVKANDATLVVIYQVNPIYVTFSVPEQSLAEIRKYMASGKLKVEAILPKDEKHPEEGVLTFIAKDENLSYPADHGDALSKQSFPIFIDRRKGKDG